MSSTAVYKCPICGNTDSRFIGTRNKEQSEISKQVIDNYKNGINTLNNDACESPKTRKP